MKEEDWNKAQRLAVAGLVAPVLRNRSIEAHKRRVGRLDRDGNVVGYTTLAKVQEALLLKKKIELEVQPDIHQKDVLCENCGKPVRLRHKATAQKRCDECAILTCSCGKKLPRNYSSPSFVAKRAGRPARCKECYAKDRVKTPPPKCSVCSKELNKDRKYSKGPIFCRKCLNEKQKRDSDAQAPKCTICNKGLGRRALYAQRLGIETKYCSNCYRGEIRGDIARKKMASDPVFAAHVKEAMKKGATTKRKSRA